MKLYKLTDQDNTTYGGFKWEIKKKYSISKEQRKKELSSEGVFHCYKSIELGLLLNPIHADICNPKVFEAEGNVEVEDYGKVGVFSLKLSKSVDVPEWYSNEKTLKRVRVQFAILCAEKVLHYFTDKYPNDNRPQRAINTAKEYLKNNISAINAAAAAAAYADAYAYAAAAAAAAAYAAAYAAINADADAAAYAAAAAAAAAINADADAAAAYAAAAYAAAAEKIDFNAIAKEAVDTIIHPELLESE